MQVYFTCIPLEKTCDMKTFIELFIEWINSSKERTIKDCVYRKELDNFRYQDVRKECKVVTLEDKEIVAARFQMMDVQKVYWTYDFIYSNQIHQLTIKVDRSVVGSGRYQIFPTMQYSFYKLLHDTGYLGLDDGIELLNQPHYITRENCEMVASIIKRKKSMLLPVIYITKNEQYEYPLNVEKLAGELSGMAHVMVEEDPLVQSRLIALCNKENPFGGYLGIYYPNRRKKPERLNPKDYYDAYDLEIAIKRNISSYMNHQNQQMTQKFDEIEKRAIRNKNEQLAKGNEDMNQEIHDLYQEYGEIEDSYKKQVERLQNRIQALELENEGLRAKLDRLEQHPVLVSGSIEEFYPGELHDVLMDILHEVSLNCREGSRRFDLLEDLIECNHYQARIQTKKEKLKQLMKGYSSMDKQLERELQKLGFFLVNDGKHYRILYYEDERYGTIMSKTGSDVREGLNIASTLGQNCF